MLSFSFSFRNAWLASSIRPLLASSRYISSSEVRGTPSACACWRIRSRRKLAELGSKILCSKPEVYSGYRAPSLRFGIKKKLSTLPLRLAFLHKGVDSLLDIFDLHQLFQIDFFG